MFLMGVYLGVLLLIIEDVKVQFHKIMLFSNMIKQIYIPISDIPLKRAP